MERIDINFLANILHTVIMFLLSDPHHDHPNINTNILNQSQFNIYPTNNLNPNLNPGNLTPNPPANRTIQTQRYQTPTSTQTEP